MMLVLQVKAQQLTPQVINSGGNSKSAGSIVLEDALGGLVVSTITTPGTMYTQDFLQPDAGITSVLPPFNNVVLNTGSGIDNAGTTFINKNAGILLEFTLGEMASKSYQQTNAIVTQGILQPYNNLEGPLPVVGLEFNAKRISNSNVQLDWKTVQEIDNKGFSIERKKENETKFAQLGFVPSAAANGNSSLPLNYMHIDTNSYAGKTYYRLKQEDIDGKFFYSVVRLVNGSNAKLVVLKAWPIPAVGNFNVVVQGIAKQETVQLFDVNGRLVKSVLVNDQIPVTINGLTPGTYILKLSSDGGLVQKVIVQ
ncbi:T9SS type A sorting domain-containing protein [Lacibacter luteus]|nr:T9SS type A sorting domain-containing protein [Lacibacter luteus]